jgi:serine/threonine protein kinase
MRAVQSRPNSFFSFSPLALVMITEQDFTILETIHSSDKSRVFLAEREQSGKKVLVKAIRDAEANVNSVIALQNEFSITQELDNSLKPHGLTYMDSSVAFVRDYLEGITLEKWMKHNPLTNAEAFELRLRLAIQIAQEIELLHNRRMIHKDINPSNIIVSEERGSVFIIDYELSSKLDIKAHFLGNPERLEGTLPYISPEQTGRMNRIIDYRCDLYSFGVVLYELFTGRKPFVFSGVNSALEYIHAHIARTPIEPFKIQPAKIQPATIADSFGQSGATLAVPKVLSNIIMKLLAKNAEDRYQSAFRLRKDVEECLRRYLSEGTISDFPVAISDIPLKFQIPQRLYGRTDERACLMESFASAASGRKMLMLVSGYSGAGKTALVYDIHIPVTERNALFIDGKFEQFQKNIPFLAWTKAFTALTELLLTENQDIIRQWKTRILAAMGDLASVITQLVPALENIIGKQPPPPIIPNNETQNRFHYALRVFIKAICTKERPLVIFIDDLQWADAASLNLLKIMMTEPGLGHLLVITAYRDNEVNTAHPFMRTVDDIQKEWLVLNALDTTEAHAPDNILVEKIALKNLSEYHINQLLADTLLQSREQIAPLARLVHTKTNGNTFFVHRFIESLYEKSLIELVTVENEPQWHFSYQAIEERTSATENVIDLLSQKIVQLPENVQKLLSKAAVLGHTFSVKMLSVLLDASVTDTEVDLWNALEESLIIPEDPSYRFIKGLGEKDPVLTRFRFAHDRVRQAVYESIQPEDKKGIHKKAALHLLETLDVRQTEQQIFEITNHLNQAFDVVEDRALLCRMNFQAGTRAKLSTAYATAFNYFEQALVPNGFCYVFQRF